VTRKYSSPDYQNGQIIPNQHTHIEMVYWQGYRDDGEVLFDLSYLPIIAWERIDDAFQPLSVDCSVPGSTGKLPQYLLYDKQREVYTDIFDYQFGLGELKSHLLMIFEQLERMEEKLKAVK